MSQFAGIGTCYSTGAVSMAEVPEKLLEGTRLLDESTASSSENETEEDSADHEGSLRAILDASESPARACRTEVMDWSDNLSGV